MGLSRIEVLGVKRNTLAIAGEIFYLGNREHLLHTAKWEGKWVTEGTSKRIEGKQRVGGKENKISTHTSARAKKRNVTVLQMP